MGCNKYGVASQVTIKEIIVPHGEDIVMELMGNAENAAISKQGEDIRMDDGSLPQISFKDGVRIRGDDLKSMPEDEEILPVQSSGVGEYHDNAGTLVAGVDALKSLGTNYWERFTDAPEEPGEVLSPISFRPREAGQATETPAIPDPQGPFAYQARAVLHAQDADLDALNQYFVNAASIADDGIAPLAWNPAGCAAVVTYLGGDGADLLAVETNDNGDIYFTLTQRALDYLRENSSETAIELYYQVAVNGQTYTMQVVVPNEGRFDSSQYWCDCKHGPQEDGTLIYGEWHAGRTAENGKVYNVTSSNMADVMTYDGAVLNSMIYAGHGSGDWGADRININCHVVAAGGANVIKANGANSAIFVNGSRSDGVVLAHTGGENHLEALGENGAIIITNDAGRGIDAGSASSVVVSAETVVLNAKEIGVYAEGDGAGVTLSAETVSINAGEAMANAYGLWANESGSSNRVEANALYVTATSGQTDASGKNAYGIYVEDADAKNSVTAANATIRAEADTGVATALYTAKGSNDLNVSDTLTLQAESARGNAYGLNVASNTASEITTGGLEIALKAGGNALGIVPTGGSSSTVNANHVSINAQGQGIATGLGGSWLQNGVNTNIVTVTGANADGNAFSVELNGAYCYGVYNGVGSTTRLTNTGSGNIDIRAGYTEDSPGEYTQTPAGWAYGFINMNGELTVQSDANMNIALAGNGAVEGFNSTGSSSVLTVDGMNSLTVDVTGYGDVAGFSPNAYGCVGINATQGGKIYLENISNLDITATAVQTTPSSVTQFHTAGILSHQSGRVEINTQTEEANAVSFTVTGNNHAAGILAYADPTNMNDATHILVGGKGTTEVAFDVTNVGEGTTQGLPKIAAGIYGKDAWTNNQTNLAEVIVTAETVNFAIKATGDAEAGALLANVASEYTLNADTVAAGVNSATGNAYGFAVVTTSENGVPSFTNVYADNVSLNVASRENNAYGLCVKAGRRESYNLIESGAEEAIAVAITVSAGSGKTAYAMYADTGYNEITGHSVTGSSSDTIRLIGSMATANGGKNTINTGSGDDMVSIDGNCAGANAVNTGNGNDTIALNGKISAGGLTVDAGDGDRDTLILTASNLAEFNEFYQAWLEALAETGGIGAMNVEYILISGAAPEDLQWLTDIAAANNIQIGPYAPFSLEAADTAISGGALARYDLSQEEVERNIEMMHETDALLLEWGVPESNGALQEDLAQTYGAYEPLGAETPPEMLLLQSGVYI